GDSGHGSDVRGRGPDTFRAGYAVNGPSAGPGPSAVEPGELGGDLGQQLAELGRLDDLEAATQAGDLAGQGAHVVAAELDLDAAVRPGGADPHPVAEDPAANGHGVGCRQGTGVIGRPALFDLVGDQAPRLGQVEPVGADD